MAHVLIPSIPQNHAMNRIPSDPLTPLHVRSNAQLYGGRWIRCCLDRGFGSAPYGNIMGVRTCVCLPCVSCVTRCGNLLRSAPADVRCVLCWRRHRIQRYSTGQQMMAEIATRSSMYTENVTKAVQTPAWHRTSLLHLSVRGGWWGVGGWGTRFPVVSPTRRHADTSLYVHQWW